MRHGQTASEGRPNVAEHSSRFTCKGYLRASSGAHQPCRYGSGYSTLDWLRGLKQSNIGLM